MMHGRVQTTGKLKSWTFLNFVLCGLLVTAAGASDKVEVRLKDPVGRKAYYKQSFNVEFRSDRSDLVLKGKQGNVNLVVNGEWKTEEEVVESDEGTEIQAVVKKGFSAGTSMGRRLEQQEFPSSLDILDEHRFKWKISDVGLPANFAPMFKAYTLDNPEMVTGIWQLWICNSRPSLPDGPVGEGDKWSAEAEFKILLETLGAGQYAVLALKSQYKVKKLKEKKGKRTLEIVEEREVGYRGLLDVGLVILLLEGKGKGSAKWVVDADEGVVLENEVRMTIDRPDITLQGEKAPLPQVKGTLEINFKRKLEKLEGA